MRGFLRSLLRAVPGLIYICRAASCSLRSVARSSQSSRFTWPQYVPARARYIDIELELQLSWEQTRRYQYSKLYYARFPFQAFDETRVLYFRIPRNRKRQTVRIRFPDSFVTGGIFQFRVDLLPHLDAFATVHGIKLVHDAATESELTVSADVLALKRATRAAVLESERTQREELPHYPESMSLEIQPGCNLQCGHCATHGTLQAHQYNNRLGAIDETRLKALAEEVFPHLTLLHLVGRGEPLMVSDSLWNLLVDQAAKHRLLLTIVNNGHFVERRIDEKSIELIDTLTISIDGISREVFAENRGGADLKRVLAAVEYFHRLRQRVCLPRRPKLCLSWTLKKNNIAEFPEFVRAMARFNPDRYYVRHLLVCHDKDAEQSLLKLPDLANRYLEEAYAEMEKQGAETDCPPLIGAVRSASTGIVASSSSEPVVNLEDSEVHSLAEAEVTTAAAGEIIATSEGAAHRSLMRDERCNYIHRTASIKAQGSMTTCGIYHARKAGDYEPESGFLSLWNGAVMQAVRRDLNTENEWEQCQNCWYRESRYQSQRDQRAKVQNYSMKNKSFYSEQAWDYRS